MPTGDGSKTTLCKMTKAVMAPLICWQKRIAKRCAQFFLSYAQVWAQNIRNEEILRRTKKDVHSLGKWCVNGPLPNMETFIQAFDIEEPDEIYLDSSKRASIW